MFVPFDWHESTGRRWWAWISRTTGSSRSQGTDGLCSSFIISYMLIIFHVSVISCVGLECLLSIVTGWARYGRKRREGHGWTPRIKGRRHLKIMYTVIIVLLITDMQLEWKVSTVCEPCHNMPFLWLTQGDKGEQGPQGPMVVFSKMLTLSVNTL